jgi:hypothetical protein
MSVVARTSAIHFVLREFIYDGSLHFYRKAELADPEVKHLTPWCAEDEPFYPARHARQEVHLHGAPDQRTGDRAVGSCRTCTALWDYANAHRGEFR